MKNRMTQTVLCPLRHWEPWAVQHQADVWSENSMLSRPVCGNVTHFWSLKLL